MESVQLPTVWVIVGQYQQVLIGVAHLLPFGVSDTLLPCPRDELRQAIREVARQTVLGGLDTASKFEDMRTAYQSLASFVPYDEANIAARLHHALERNHFAFLASPEAEAARRLTRQIEREASRLTREFDTWISEHSDPVLQEVNTVLIEFERKQIATPG